eukprot:TRINITY_DN12617_c0_g1_i5.p1 TRINITY_DN12617_c0_g1~~TRINITY_DN12617_c0_g1_i5.p1  ORF type:complete len:303 (+),score=71.47 TRINITY_DN12617_c0_g1_i5:112-1020(+)
MLRSLVGSEMCIRDRYQRRVRGPSNPLNMGWLSHFLTPAVGTVLMLLASQHPRTWAALVDPLPRGWYALTLENLGIWMLVYGLAYLILFVEPHRTVFSKLKFQPKYPAPSLVAKEILRSIRGVLICTAMEHGLTLAYANRPPDAPLLAPRFLATTGELGAGAAAAAGLALFLWSDFHFYWTHRLLHQSSWLYRHVHSVHHQSFNPDPFSGLSMHWIESSIYFSSGPMAALVSPAWMSRLLMKGLIVAPLFGHWGHGSWEVESIFNHYIHHTKFYWNYGSTPLWDHLMGTTLLSCVNWLHCLA